MLKRFAIRGYKSLLDVEVRFNEASRLAVVVGENAAGKTSLLKAIEMSLEAFAPVEGESANAFYPICHLMLRDGRLSNAYTKSRTRKSNDRIALVLDADDLNVACQFDDERADLQVDDDGQVLGASLALSSGSTKLNAPQAWRTKVPRARYVHLSSATMQKPTVPEDEQPTMTESGAGLPSVIASLAKTYPEARTKLETELRAILPSVKGVRVVNERTRHTSKMLVEGEEVPVAQDRIGDALQLSIADHGWLPASDVSDGTLLTLGLLTALLSLDGPTVLLVDDIDRGLHPSAQQELIAAVRRLLDARPELQVICTTHSPYLLDNFETEEVIVVSADDKGYTHAAPLSDHPDYVRFKELMRAGEFWSTVGESWVAREAH